MTDKTAFKKTLYRFYHEANILLRSNWDESPAPFKRFLDRIEAEPDVKAYLDDCVDNYTPEGFNAEENVREVAGNLGTTLINFSTIPEEESAEVYLILKEMIARTFPVEVIFTTPLRVEINLQICTKASWTKLYGASSQT